MKKILLISLLIEFLIFSVGFCENTPILISGMVNYPPVMWEENGKYVGIAQELARKVFDELGVTYQFKVLPWKRAQEEAKTGMIDVITGIYWNAERDVFLSYSKPFMSDPAVLFIRQDKKFPYGKWSDLIDKTGIMNQGYSWGEAFDRFRAENLQVVWVENPEQAFNMLCHQERKVDYYLYGLLPGMIVVNRLNLKDQIDYIPNYITDEKFYIAFSKKSSYLHLLPQVNAVIDRLVNEKFLDYLFTLYINYYQDNQPHEKIKAQ